MMASFQKFTRKPMATNTALEGVGIANVPKSGTGGDTGAFGGNCCTVGATGDSAAKSGTGGDTSFLSKATSAVGATGDNAAKSGKGD